MNNTVFLDLETTGFPASSDVLEVGLVGADGDILLHSLLSPIRASEWPHAQAVHGISPAMVVGKPTWADVLPKVLELCEGSDVVIYNKAFDIKFCPGLKEVANEVHCCMIRFAAHHGEIGSNGYKWQKLVRAAALTGFTWPDTGAHSAVNDALATRHVWGFLENVNAKYA